MEEAVIPHGGAKNTIKLCPKGQKVGLKAAVFFTQGYLLEGRKRSYTPDSPHQLYDKVYLTLVMERSPTEVVPSL